MPRRQLLVLGYYSILQLFSSCYRQLFLRLDERLCHYYHDDEKKTIDMLLAFNYL